ncbi:hypothetical protein [Celeribacter sp. ULVN23_4]
MARNLYWVSDEEWASIQPHLPTGRRGGRRVDDQGSCPDRRGAAAA